MVEQKCFKTNFAHNFSKWHHVTGQPGMKEPNPLHDLLFGEQVQIFSYEMPDTESQEQKDDKKKETSQEASRETSLVVNEECSDFLQIFLDVKYKNLYSAWAASSQQDVDYTTPSGSKAGSLGEPEFSWMILSIALVYMIHISQHIISLWNGNDLNA